MQEADPRHLIASAAAETVRLTRVIEVLTSAGIPFDDVTAIALDRLCDQLTSVLQAEALQSHDAKDS